MTSRARRFLGAHLVGLVALFVALGGTAGAAVILSSNSQVGPGVVAGSAAASGTIDNVINGTLGTADLGSGAIPSRALADGSVTSPRIRDGTVATTDLADGAATAGKLAPQSVGPAAFAAHSVGTGALAGDARRRMDFDLMPTGDIADVKVDSLDFFATCVTRNGQPALWLSPSNLDPTTPGSLNISGVAQSTGGAPRVVLSSTSVAGCGSSLVTVFSGVSGESGTASLEWDTGGAATQGVLSWLVDGTHCVVHGLLMAPHQTTA